MKKLVFISPKGKGGTYYYYKDITEYLINNYGNKYDVIFCNTLSDFLLRHFKKADIIFSIIPFFFKPLGAKKYIFNLHGNYKKERESNNLGAKLQYFAGLNLWFSDNILMTSYFLADKLGFRDKYKDKILISPLFLKDIKGSVRKNHHSPLRLLTVSSTNFLEKGMGVYYLAEQIFKIKGIDIFWKVVFPGNIDNRKFILDKISKLSKRKNIRYEVLNFISREELGDLYNKSDIFVYATNLDTWGGVIMEACSYGLPIILMPYELWEYIYPDFFIEKENIEIKINNITTNYVNFSNKSINFAKKYIIEKIVSKFISF